MIEVRCPGCEALLRIRDELRGKTGACPKCKSRVHIPGHAEGFDVVVEDNVRVPVIRAQRQTALLPPPRQVREYDEYEDERPRPVRRRRRRRQFDGGNAIVIGVSAALGVGLLCCVLSLLHWGFAFPAILIGMALGATGGIWHLVLAFQEDPICGIMCMFVPFYSLYYLITRWDETMRPFLVNLAGTFLLFAAFICLIAMVPKDRQAKFNNGEPGMFQPPNMAPRRGR